MAAAAAAAAAATATAATGLQWRSAAVGAGCTALLAALLWVLDTRRRGSSVVQGVGAQGAGGKGAATVAAAAAGGAGVAATAPPAAAAAAATAGGAAGVLAIDDENDCTAVADDVDLKMVFCVRGDLNMSKGKIAAQVGHATLACWQAAGRTLQWRQWAQAWNYRAAAKITLVVDTEEQLDAIAAAAAAAGLPHVTIEDAGRTEIAPGSRTVLGIGPAPVALVDAITGRGGAYPLKLLR